MLFSLYTVDFKSDTIEFFDRKKIQSNANLNLAYWKPETDVIKFDYNTGLSSQVTLQWKLTLLKEKYFYFSKIWLVASVNRGIIIRNS